MPGFNQKGPFGQGSMTGRRMGRCTNFGAKQKNMEKGESENQFEVFTEEHPEKESGLGRNLGFKRGGRGRGRGRQNRFRGDF